MNAQRASTSEKSKRSGTFFGSTEYRLQDSWKKWGEGFEGIPLEGPSQRRNSLLGAPSVDEKEIDTFSSDSDEDLEIKIQPQISQINRKRKRVSHRKPVKRLFTSHPQIAQNDDVDIDTFSPSKLSGKSAKPSKKESQNADDFIETFSPCKPSQKSLKLSKNVFNNTEDDTIEAEAEESRAENSSNAPITTYKDTFKISGSAEILDYSSGEELDSRQCHDDSTEITDQHEDLEGKAGTSSDIAPSRGVLQRLKLDSAASGNEPSRLDDPSPRKRNKYIKGQLADRLSKLMMRESSEVAFWKHKVSKKAFKEDSTKTMTLEVQHTQTSLTVTMAKCKVLEDNCEEGRTNGSVSILLNKKHATSLKISESQVLKIYPPWQEINMASGETMLLCGRFCRVVKPAESEKTKPLCSGLDDGAAHDCVTYRWFYQVDVGE